MAANARGVPQIVFKVVRNGGCHGANGLAAQMDYVLGKAEHIIDPNKEIDRLDHLPVEYSRAMAAEWADGWNRKVDSGHSMHMVASFPRGTDPEAVAEIIRATCFDLLDQGRSRFNYVAAVHTDKDHPHAHIIVDRRNAEGEFFYFARDHEFTYDVFKDKIVEHAAAYGVELVNSSRMSRGLTAPAASHPREALRGLQGTLVAFGAAPYQNKPKERASYFVTVQTPAGEKTLWGKELRAAMEAEHPAIGDRIRITHEGKEAVSVPQRTDGWRRIETVGLSSCRSVLIRTQRQDRVQQPVGGLPDPPVMKKSARRSGATRRSRNTSKNIETCLRALAANIPRCPRGLPSLRRRWSRAGPLQVNSSKP